MPHPPTIWSTERPSLVHFAATECCSSSSKYLQCPSNPIHLLQLSPLFFPKHMQLSPPNFLLEAHQVLYLANMHVFLHLKQFISAITSVQSAESRASASNSQGAFTANPMHLIRKKPSCFCISRALNAGNSFVSGQFQDIENDKVAQQERNVTISKIDKDALDRLTEESRQLKFLHETTLRDFTSTKSRLVCFVVQCFAFTILPVDLKCRKT
jgi:hypothetical protein